MGALLVAISLVSILGLEFFFSRASAPATDSADSESDLVPEVETQAPDAYAMSQSNLDQRIIDFSYAIGRAEGFGVPNAIPTRYNNPGDLKPPTGKAGFWSGQTGVGTGGHAIFASVNDGWNALRKQIRLWAINQSSVAGTKDTFQSLAKKYAEDWQPWLANVIAELNSRGHQVSASSTLGDYFYGN